MKILKIAFDGGGLKNGRGSANAPDNIVLCLNEIFSNESEEEIKFETENVKVDNYNIEITHAEIEKAASKNEKMIAIGGDHSITYPLVKGFSKNRKTKR